MGSCEQARPRTLVPPSHPLPLSYTGCLGKQKVSLPHIPFPLAAVKTTEHFSQLKRGLTDSPCSHWGQGSGGPGDPTLMEPAG